MDKNLFYLMLQQAENMPHMMNMLRAAVSVDECTDVNKTITAKQYTIDVKVRYTEPFKALGGACTVAETSFAFSFRGQKDCVLTAQMKNKTLSLEISLNDVKLRGEYTEGNPTNNREFLINGARVGYTQGFNVFKQYVTQFLCSQMDARTFGVLG